jgi:phage terminase large subunit-like protein
VTAPVDDFWLSDEDIAALTPGERRRYDRILDHQLAELAKWENAARPNQLPPDGEWRLWVFLAGRGTGKTRAGAEWSADRGRELPGARIALVGPRFADVRDTMVEGDSGLLSVLRDDELREGSRDTAWSRSLGELFLCNGSRYKAFSSERPAQLRGPQHHFAWADEAAVWDDAFKGDVLDTTWNNLTIGLRLGRRPRVMVSTTPKPVRLIRGLLDQDDAAVTRGSTYENLANLAPTYREQVIARYEGTRLARQELHGEMILEADGALWTWELIDAHREPAPTSNGHGIPDLAHIAVAVDPAFSGAEGADEAGIIVGGVAYGLRDGRAHAYVLDDRSCHGGPDVWAKRAVQAYRDHEADAVVVESNLGGAEFAAKTIRQVDASVRVRTVRASRGKRLRGEPVAMLYDQGRVHHVRPFPELEEQMTGWTPDSGDSPDRLDALVWLLTDLLIDGAHRPATLSTRQITAVRF